MKAKRKPVVHGGDYIRDPCWRPIKATRLQAKRIGIKRMSEDLKRAGFECVVFDAGDYYRISYGYQKEEQ